MIQKPYQSRRTLAWVLGVLMLASWATGFASTFTVKITPTGSGQVMWTTTYPNDGGMITGSGGSFTYTMNSSYVVLTFIPNLGGSVVKVMTDEGDDTAWVLAHSNTDSWYGPSESSKKVTVTFSGGTTPVIDPTGVFGFSFPTNNPLLTAITDISGTHTGTTATVSAAHPRLYSVVIAQDESGKLSIMSGAVEGIVPNGGSPTKAAFSGPVVIGAITTVNNQPTAQLKGKFEGTVDGAATTASGSGQGPVAVSDIGGGTNGISGTGSGSAKVAGVPYSAKNTPITLPAPNALSHIHKSWSIALTITNTASAGAKSSIMASAMLTLPNGDLIAFPAKKTKYSAAGYKLSFKGGTNMTIVPNAVDKKTKVSITGMTLTKTGSIWNPTAGSISYQFLGQKGTADLMLFVSP
jgi:hypothetical protein